MIKKRLAAFGVVLCMTASVITGCTGKADETNESANESTEKIEVGKFSPITNITYSAGTDSNWSYGNQRKEFPSDIPCYVRIGSTMITDKGSEVGEKIVITYTFTGGDACEISPSDGIVEAVESGDSNVVQYQKTIEAAKEKNAQEDVVIFRYDPKGEGNVQLKITYSDRVDDKYDQLNTIYFSPSAQLTVEEKAAVEENGSNEASTEPDDRQTQTH